MKKLRVDHRREEHGPHQSSHLFLLRVWIEGKDESHGTDDLAGKLQDPVSGQIQYFRGAMELVRTLHRLISRKEVNRSGKHPEGGQL